jgi:NTP pyrophosphatase (non-canonical NTP hydrolase)
MTITEYLTESARTLVPGSTERENLVHAALGLVTECQELTEACNNSDEINITEELGDLAWYIALLDRTVEKQGGFTYSLEYNPCYTIETQMERTVASVADQAKRVYFYGAPADTVQLTSNLDLLWTLWFELCHRLDRNPEQVLELNIGKLRARYPTKFSGGAALNRDIEAERSIIEGSNE